MNPFVSRINRSSWEIWVSLVCLMLGIMISLAWISPATRSTRLGSLDPDQSARVASMSNVPADVPEKSNSKLEDEIARLRNDTTRLQNALADRSKEAAALNQSLQENKVFAGLTEVEGPGVTVTLRDSQKPPPATVSPTDVIIHDVDVLKVVNELWAAGAEAIAVNNHRVSVGTSFRCVGPVILVDGTRIASPVVIRAIGDPDTLLGALNLPGGALTEIRSLDPAMIQLERVKKHILPAFAGSTHHALLSVPKSSK